MRLRGARGEAQGGASNALCGSRATGAAEAHPSLNARSMRTCCTETVLPPHTLSICFRCRPTVTRPALVASPVPVGSVLKPGILTPACCTAGCAASTALTSELPCSLQLDLQAFRLLLSKLIKDQIRERAHDARLDSLPDRVSSRVYSLCSRLDVPLFHVAFLRQTSRFTKSTRKAFFPSTRLSKGRSSFAD